jgi:type I restriction enzyme, S subunit
MPTKNKTQKLVPELRFPEFRGAGEWDEKPLSACLDYKQPTPYLVSDSNYSPAFKTPVLTAGKTFILGYTDEEHGIFSEDLPVIIFDDFTTATQFVDFPFKAKSSAMKILQAKDGVNIKFMFEALQMLSYEVGAHERHWISTFAPTLFLIPTLPEQQKIADCLGSLDELLAAHRRKLAALQDHKKGLLQQLFPAEGETTPNLRFPGFEGEWETDALSKLVKVYPGFGFPDRLQGNSDGDFPFYKVSDISKCIERGGYQISKSANYVDQNTVDELRAKTLPAGATIFAKIGEAIRLNRRVITTRPCLIDNNAAGVYPLLKDTSFLFLYYLFCTIRLIDYAGGVVPAISKTAIESIIVSWPSPPEQQTIADCLSALDALITAQTDQIAALHAHKKGLMQQLFPNPQGVA